MNTDDKRVVKAGFWYTISNFITKGSVLITTPIFSRLLSKTDMGVTSNFSAWIIVLLPLLTFDYYMSIQIARFDYKDELDRYCSSVLVYGTSITLVFYLLAILFKDIFCPFFELNEIQLHIMFWYFLFYPAFSIFQAQNLIYYKYKASTIFSMGGFFLSNIVAIIMILFADDKGTANILGHRGVTIVISMGLFIYILKKGRGVSLKYFKYATTISFPLIWHSISLYVLASSDRIIITKYIGKEAAALYAIAYTSSHAISILYHGMNNALSPWALVQIHEDNSAKHRSICRIYILAMFAMMIGLLLISPEVLLIMGGRKYMESIAVLPPALLAVAPQVVYSLYINSENYLKKQKYIAIGTTSAALLNIILNIIFIPKYGYVAAAYTTFAGYFFLYLFHFIIASKLGMRRFYDSLLYFIVVLVAMALIPVFTWMYGHTMIRYALVAVYGIAFIAAVIIFRDKLLQLAKMFLNRKKKKQA